MQQDLKVQKQGKKGAALMRYSDEVIEEVRARNDVVDVIGGYIHLQKKGSNYFGLCPFHNEKSPSFSVSPQKQMYYCFGCGKGGNVITFVMDYEQQLADFAHILEQKRLVTASCRKRKKAKRAEGRQIIEAFCFQYKRKQPYIFTIS